MMGSRVVASVALMDPTVTFEDDSGSESFVIVCLPAETAKLVACARHAADESGG